MFPRYKSFPNFLRDLHPKTDSKALFEEDNQTDLPRELSAEAVYEHRPETPARRRRNTPTVSHSPLGGEQNTQV